MVLRPRPLPGLRGGEPAQHQRERIDAWKQFLTQDQGHLRVSLPVHQADEAVQNLQEPVTERLFLRLGGGPGRQRAASLVDVQRPVQPLHRLGQAVLRGRGLALLEAAGDLLDALLQPRDVVQGLGDRLPDCLLYTSDAADEL